MTLNVNLGTPYEMIIKKLIAQGYAGTQTEVIRQALMFYERQIAEEEVRLVNKGIAAEMEEIKSGKIKTKSITEIKKKYSM
ncbi:hypothetical protein KJ780_04075 [Candidatus Micrarchaeota archaeon]|nr:hypothetical protein [Candidatus Micrarchaeota archaeon]